MPLLPVGSRLPRRREREREMRASRGAPETRRSRWESRRPWGTCAAPGRGYVRVMIDTKVLSKGRSDATTEKRQGTWPELTRFRGRRRKGQCRWPANVTKEVRHVARVDTVPSPRPKKERPGALPMAGQPFMAEQAAPEQQPFDFPDPKC